VYSRGKKFIVLRVNDDPIFILNSFFNIHGNFPMHKRSFIEEKGCFIEEKKIVISRTLY